MGKTLATQPIQKAIDAASAAGGGAVSLPPGTFRSATLYLKNSITLSLEPGATLLGSTDPHDYAVAAKASGMRR
jgi:polygalacturonase